MVSRLGLGKQKFILTGGYILTVLDVFRYKLFKSKEMRNQLAIFVCQQGNHICPKVVLQLGLFVKSTDDLRRVGCSFHFNDNTDAIFFTGFIADISNIFNYIFLGKLVNGLNDLGLVNLIRNGCKNNLLFAVFDILDSVIRPNGNFTFASGIHADNTIRALNCTATREIRPLDIFHQSQGIQLRVVYFSNNAFDNLSKIVWSHLACKTYGNALTAVYQHIRESGRQHGWFKEGFIVVAHHIDSFFVDILYHNV